MSKLSVWKSVRLTLAGVALSLLAASVVRADSFSDQAAKLDVVGVHLGMTPAQVKSVLAQHRKGMQWGETKGADFGQQGPYLAGATARWGYVKLYIGETVSVIFSPPPGGQKVVAVLRDVSFEKSQAPTVEGLVSSLTEKFGQPGYKPVPTTFVWAWDKAGQVAKPDPGVYVCQVDNSNLDRMGYLSLDFVSILQQANDGACAMVMQAIIDGDPGGIASELRMTLIDAHDALLAAIAADNHRKQVDQAKKDETLKKASANKPSL